jgi:HPt (histidine-containing phosphotransfer) domain-containing protein
MIDWARIRELHDEIGAEDFQLVTDLFLSEVGNSIAALGHASGDASQMAEKMHALKGAALNLGFSALADLAFAGERAAMAGDTHAVTPGEMRHVFEASIASFQADRASKLAA